MRIEDMNWMDVEAYLNHDDRIILPLGSTEQHGYLSLLTDTRVAQAVSDAVSQRSGVLVAPAIAYGCNPYFSAYPGNMTLRVTTLLDIVEDVIRAAYFHGFRKFLVINGHGGNAPAYSRISELLNVLPGMKARWYQWWDSPATQEIAKKYGMLTEHASWMEAFAFTRVCELPDGEKPRPVPQSDLMNAEEYKATYGDGMMGGHYKADLKIMDEVFAAITEEALVQVRW